MLTELVVEVIEPMVMYCCGIGIKVLLTVEIAVYIEIFLESLHWCSLFVTASLYTFSTHCKYKQEM